MKVESPCIGICQLDSKEKSCLGCFRTLQEINDWSSYSRDEKLEILKLLKGRENE